MNIIVPSDVPETQADLFTQRYHTITNGTGNLALFAADHKIEHLNPVNPTTFFAIAENGAMNTMATHVGLINRYEKRYTNISYIAKLNAKTNLMPQTFDDPLSRSLWYVEDLIGQINNRTSIKGVGYTIYLGSDYEDVMLQEAAHIINTAHAYGLITILWLYPRGRAIKEERDGALIAGATGVAASLGSDFVKVKMPLATNGTSSTEWLKKAVDSAGTTKAICSGGEQIKTNELLTQLHQQLQAGTAGCAIGRNIHQRTFDEACALSRAIAALVYRNASIDEAYALFKRQ